MSNLSVYLPMLKNSENMPMVLEELSAMGEKQVLQESRYRYPYLTYFCGTLLCTTFLLAFSNLINSPFHYPDTFQILLVQILATLIPGTLILYLEIQGSTRGQELAGIFYLVFTFLCVFQSPFDGNAESISWAQLHLIYTLGGLMLIAMAFCLYNPKATLSKR